MAKNGRRLLALLLTYIVLFTGCTGQNGASGSNGNAASAPAVSGQASSTNETDDKGGEKDETLRVAWFESAGLNPYLSDNVYLRQLSALLYRHMVDITPEMGLRETSVQVRAVEDGVELIPHAAMLFADGEPVGAEDIAASLQAAIESDTYGGRFAAVRSVLAEEDRVLVALDQPDPLFACLLDIPVLKAGEVGDEEPTASGRYVLSTDKKGLRSNTYYGITDAVYADRPDIELVSLISYDDLLARFTAGGVSLLAVEGEAQGVSATVAQQVYYPLNQLVFVGVNAASDGYGGQILGTAEGRKALSDAIDRDEIAAGAYLGRATGATGFYNPLYRLADGGLKVKDDGGAALRALLEAGEFETDAAGYYLDAIGERLTLHLLYSEGAAAHTTAAQLIEQSLNDAGISVQLEGVSAESEEYAQKITDGDFELYIGEVKLYNNMDFSYLLGAGDASAAFATAQGLEEVLAAYREGEAGAAAVEAAFAAELPWVPLVWRSGTVYADKRLTGVAASVSDPFYEIPRFGSAEQ